jgi:hypothetical protein
MSFMKTSVATTGTALACALLAGSLVATPAFADTYPASGKWGVSTSTQKGPVDCGKLRVISFNGDQRTDSGGGVPAYRNRSVTPDGINRYRVVDVFTNGMVNNGQVNYTLRLSDADHLELNMQKGGLLKLRRCK